MAIRISQHNLMNTETRRRIKRKSLFKITKGRVTSTVSKSGRDRLKIHRMAAKIAKKGNLHYQMSSNNIDDIAKDVLEIIGCACVYDPHLNRPNYSLLDNQTSPELINNPNKVDYRDYTYVDKGKVEFQDVLKNEFDNFYNLDDSLPRDYKQQVDDYEKQKKENYNFAHIAVGIFDMNYNNPYSTNIRALTRK